MDKKNFTKVFCIAIFMLAPFLNQGQELYEMPKNTQTRWASFENSGAEKGAGGLENKGGKGHPFNPVKAGESINLLNVQGSGTVRRIWLTISDRSPEMLRSLKINMYWDNMEKPAVTVPLGDFFGIGLGQRVRFESALFADPEARSFLCFIPMPFKEAAKITLSNDADKDLEAIFYDINITKEDHPEDNMLYFHAYWNRELKTEVGKDFQILPQIEGKGRFLGTNVGVLANEMYKNSWFGEGEVKIYLDGDKEAPTLVGSGTEDYIGTAYGQGTYSQLYQGSPIANDKQGEFAFYRYHIPDPVYFYEEIKVELQQMGGAPNKTIRGFIEKGAKLKPVTIGVGPKLYKLLGTDSDIEFGKPDTPQGWTNFYRQDDVSATAYFYIDKPTNNLPALQPVKTRTANLTDKRGKN